MSGLAGYIQGAGARVATVADFGAHRIQLFQGLRASAIRQARVVNAMLTCQFRQWNVELVLQ